MLADHNSTVLKHSLYHVTPCVKMPCMEWVFTYDTHMKNGCVRNIVVTGIYFRRLDCKREN